MYLTTNNLYGVKTQNINITLTHTCIDVYLLSWVESRVFKEKEKKKFNKYRTKLTTLSTRSGHNYINRLLNLELTITVVLKRVLNKKGSSK